MNKIYKNMKLVLTNEASEEITLEYEIRQNEVAQIWAQCIDMANPTGLYEDRRFYNWNARSPQNEIQKLVGTLETIINRLSTAHPELNFPRLEKDRLQESLNHLHQNFAHGSLVEDFARQKHKDLWCEFNVCIHAIESAILAKRALETTGVTDSHLVVTWKDSQIIDFKDHHYNEFEMDIYFGHAYLNYAQVGRHLVELYRSGDTDIPIEHIQPARVMSADTFLWFGSSSGHWSAAWYLAQIKNWFDRNQNKFNKIGLIWGDPKCALGQIAVARLKDLPYSKAEIIDYQKRLIPYSRVKSLKVDSTFESTQP